MFSAAAAKQRKRHVIKYISMQSEDKVVLNLLKREITPANALHRGNGNKQWLRCQTGRKIVLVKSSSLRSLSHCASSSWTETHEDEAQKEQRTVLEIAAAFPPH